MRIGIMQPYFFPYLGYISLIKQTKNFILLDEVQFIRHGWIERNRILNPSGGWIYIAIPLLKHSRKTLIKEIKINNEINWRRKLFAQLEHYKKAPYYKSVIKRIEEVLENEFEDIVSLNKACLIAVCDYLEIESDIKVFSQMNLPIDPINAPDEWALNICKAIGNTTEYWNPFGGIELFERRKYEQAGIDLSFQKIEFSEYSQAGKRFESGLSIIDVMMFNDIEKINNMLDRFELL